MPASFLGELLGTMVLILLGNGVVANVLLTQSKGNGGGWIVITAGWAFAVMAGIASVSKRDFTNMAKFLTVGVMLLIVASLANIFFQLPALMLTISVLAIGIFSAFILVDIQRIIQGGEDNYITATLGIYLSLYNIFSNLLAILGIFGGDRE